MEMWECQHREILLSIKEIGLQCVLTLLTMNVSKTVNITNPFLQEINESFSQPDKNIHTIVGKKKW